MVCKTSAGSAPLCNTSAVWNRLACPPAAAGGGLSRCTWLNRCDAWNRLAEVKRAHRAYPTGTLTDGSTVATMSYDGLGRRIKKAVSNCGDWNGTCHYYYDGQRMIEVRDGSWDVLKQHVWGQTYVDEIVQIGINDDPTDAGEDDCETSYYALQDANFNVTALIERGDGSVLERYEYDPYGSVTVLNPSWQEYYPSYDNEILYCGYRWDPESGLYHVRYRMYHPTLGRWMQRDPIGYADAMSLYEYVASNPAVDLDPKDIAAGLGDVLATDKPFRFLRAKVQCATPPTSGAIKLVWGLKRA